jgi:hypothetical protein
MYFRDRRLAGRRAELREGIQRLVALGVISREVADRDDHDLFAFLRKVCALWLEREEETGLITPEDAAEIREGFRSKTDDEEFAEMFVTFICVFAQLAEGKQGRRRKAPASAFRSYVSSLAG